MKVDCSKARILIQDYLDGTLEVAERGLLEAHISVCRSCTSELSAYRGVFNLLENLGLEDAPDGLGDAVIERLEPMGSFSRTRWAPRRVLSRLTSLIPGRLRYPLAAAALVLAAYWPLKTLWALIKSAAAKAAVGAADLFLAAHDAIKDMGLLYRFLEGIEKDLRALKTVVNALSPWLASAREELILPGIGGIIISVLILVLYLKNVERRSSHHASYCF